MYEQSCSTSDPKRSWSVRIYKKRYSQEDFCKDWQQSKYRNLTPFHVVWSVPVKVFLTVTFSVLKLSIRVFGRHSMIKWWLHVYEFLKFEARNENINEEIIAVKDAPYAVAAMNFSLFFTFHDGPSWNLPILNTIQDISLICTIMYFIYSMSLTCTLTLIMIMKQFCTYVRLPVRL